MHEARKQTATAGFCLHKAQLSTWLSTGLVAPLAGAGLSADKAERRGFSSDKISELEAGAPSEGAQPQQNSTKPSVEELNPAQLLKVGRAWAACCPSASNSSCCGSWNMTARLLTCRAFVLQPVLCTLWLHDGAQQAALPALGTDASNQENNISCLPVIFNVALKHAACLQRMSIMRFREHLANLAETTPSISYQELLQQCQERCLPELVPDLPDSKASV